MTRLFLPTVGTVRLTLLTAACRVAYVVGLLVAAVCLALVCLSLL